VTGERDALAAQAVVTGRRAKAVTDVPVLLGVGISTPAQAAEAASASDGVVVGSALIARLLDGEGPEGAHALIAAFRAALDDVGEEDREAS
jgi:tryptophan synthase alpha chain